MSNNQLDIDSPEWAKKHPRLAALRKQIDAEEADFLLTIDDTKFLLNEALQGVDTGENYHEFICDVWALVYPGQRNEWDYPAQVIRHLGDEMTALRARMETQRRRISELEEGGDTGG